LIKRSARRKPALMSKASALDRFGRRSRFRRQPTGKPVCLTERDLDILSALYRYRYLRATQLVALLRPKSEKRFIERLGNLYHEAGLVDRPEQQWRRFDARYQPIVYELSAKGLRHLESGGELPARAVTFARGRHAPAPRFDHAMMIVDALVSAELETRHASGQRFVPVDEILLRRPRAERGVNAPKHPLAVPVTIKPNRHLPFLKKPFGMHLVPDGLYGIEHTMEGEKRYRFYALECEHRSPLSRSTASYSSLALKQAAYEALIEAKTHREAWGIPNLSLKICATRGAAGR
jgi:hypothetical protein